MAETQGFIIGERVLIIQELYNGLYGNVLYIGEVFIIGFILR